MLVVTRLASSRPGPLFGSMVEAAGGQVYVISSSSSSSSSSLTQGIDSVFSELLPGGHGSGRHYAVPTSAASDPQSQLSSAFSDAVGWAEGGGAKGRRQRLHHAVSTTVQSNSVNGNFRSRQFSRKTVPGMYVYLAKF